MEFNWQISGLGEHRAEYGFTTLEVIAVLVIVGIIAVIAVSRMSGLWTAAYGDADRLASDLRYAQTLAMTRVPESLSGGDSNEVKVEIKSDGWEFEDSRWHFADGETNRSVQWGVSINGDDVIFEYPYGSPQAEENVEINLERGSHTITICIYADTGYVEILE